MEKIKNIIKKIKFKILKKLLSDLKITVFVFENFESDEIRFEDNNFNKLDISNFTVEVIRE